MIFARRSICFAVLAVVTMHVFLSCAAESPAAPASARFECFTQIPGITDEQIRAVEVLRENFDYFTYGMTQNAEAFNCAANNDEIFGFTVYFTNWLSQLFDIRFVPQIYTMSEVFEGLENGTIHFTGQLTRLPSREKIYHMTAPIVSRQLMAVREIGSNTPAQIASAGEGVPRFIFLANTVTPGILRDSRAFDAFEEIFVDTAEEAVELLEGGYADAFIGDLSQAILLADYYPTMIMEALCPIVIRPAAFSAQNPDLFPIVDIVQLALDGGALPILGEFYARGMTEFNRHRLFSMLTEDELDFLALNPVIPIAMRAVAYPASFFNAHDEDFQGITRDVIQQLEELLGISFKPVHTAPLERNEIQSMLRNQDILMAAGIIRPTDYAALPSLYSEAFFTDNFAILSRTDFPPIGVGEIMYFSVGLPSNEVYQEAFTSWFYDHNNTYTFATTKELFNALLREDIDVVFSTRAGFLGSVNYFELDGLRLNILFDESYDIGFAIAPNEYILQSILNKALVVIDTDFIANYWMSRTFDFSILRMEAVVARQEQRTMTVIISTVLIGLMLLAVLVVGSIERKRLARILVKKTASLELETATLNALFDMIPDVIFCKDKDFIHTRANQQFLDLFQVKREDVLGKSELSFMNLPDDVIETFHDLDNRVMKERITHQLEETVPTSNGEIRIYETIKVPMIVDDDVVGILGIAQDITRRKELETEAIYTSRAKTAFIANMSHEIRTPMNSIVGFSELALEENLPQKARTYLTHIVESSNWLLQIINDILDISKIESGKLELENVPFKLYDIFTSCKSMILPKAMEKGINVHFYAEPGQKGKVLLGDAFRLRQIIINLLTNAVKFTHVGIVKTHSTVISSSDDTQTIYIEVQDTGIGMTDEQIARASEPFMQADISITRKYGGTGLGLPIVTKLLNMMGGELTIESSLGEGSKFSFTLTFKTENITAEDSRMPMQALGRPKFSGEVLVCEDNGMNQMVISEHLSRLGLDTVIAENGLIGVEMVQSRMAAQEKPFDLIFMDIHMPIMDGIDAASKLADLGCTTPIVALTANVMATDREAYVEYGMKDCVGKPFTSEELWRCLLKYFTPVSWSEGYEPEKNYTDDETQLLRRLQESFVRDNSNKFADMRTALAIGDTKLAHRMAHNLKSTAGLVNRPGLRDIAASIEGLLGDGFPIPPKKLQKLEEEINDALEAFAEVDSEADSAEDKPIDNAQDVLALLEKLEPLIKSRSPDSHEYISDLARIPDAHELVSLIQSYDFKPALKTLVKLKETWRLT